MLHPIRALNQVIEEYRDYLRTEFRAKDPGLRAALEAELDRPGFLAREALYQAHRTIGQDSQSVDGAAYHAGPRLRRDRAIREQLRVGAPPWTVVELRAADLARGADLVREIATC